MSLNARYCAAQPSARHDLQKFPNGKKIDKHISLNDWFGGARQFEERRGK